MAREIKKKDRICVVCGKTFKGIASAQTCTPACRIDLVRLKEAGKRPEFLLMAKGKGQKIPDLDAPKRVKYAKGEKKQSDIGKGILQIIKESNPAKYESMTMEGFVNINWAETTPAAYDAPPLNRLILDEVGSMPPPMTKEQIIQHNFEIDKQIKDIKSQECPRNKHPKAFIQYKESAISELENLKIHPNL